MKKFQKIALLAAFAAMLAGMTPAQAAAQTTGVAPVPGTNGAPILAGERPAVVFQSTAVRRGDAYGEWDRRGMGYHDDARYRSELRRIQFERRQLERDIEQLRREEARLENRHAHSRYRSEKKRIERERKAKERRLKELKREEERLRRHHYRR